MLQTLQELHESTHSQSNNMESSASHAPSERSVATWQQARLPGSFTQIFSEF